MLGEILRALAAWILGLVCHRVLQERARALECGSAAAERAGGLLQHGRRGLVAVALELVREGLELRAVLRCERARDALLHDARAESLEREPHKADARGDAEHASYDFFLSQHLFSSFRSRIMEPSSIEPSPRRFCACLRGRSYFAHTMRGVAFSLCLRC